MYMQITSAPNPSNLNALSDLDTALQTSVASPGVPAGMTGYVSDSVRQRLMEFYPPPYGFASGMGDCGCGGNCGGCKGMGQDTSGLFASGTDISGWGWEEWGIVGLGAFAVLSAVQNISSAGSSLGKSVKSYQRRAKKRAALKSELSETGWF
jgi:hypothetical protein